MKVTGSDFAEIGETDINPVLAFEIRQGAAVANARIKILRKASCTEGTPAGVSQRS